MNARIMPGLKALPFSVIALWLGCLGSAQALTTFTANTPAKASEVNANFSELSGRIDDLEALHSGESIAVDCAADEDALTNALTSASEGDTLQISGVCTGPIKVDVPRVTLTTASSGSHGISSSGVLPDAVLSIRAPHVTVSNLLIVATEESDSMGVFVGRNGSATIDQLTISGAEKAIGVGRNGSASIYNIAVSSTDNIIVYDGGRARFFDGNAEFQLGVFRTGVVDFREEADGMTLSRVSVTDGGRVIIRGSGTEITVNGRVSVFRNSSVTAQSTLNINHNNYGEPGLFVQENSSVKLTGGTVTAPVEVLGSSTLVTNGTSFVDPVNNSNGACIVVGLASAVVLSGGTSAGGVEADGNSSVLVDNSTLTGCGSSDPVVVDLSSGAQMDADNGSVLTGYVSVATGGNFELDGSTLNGDIGAYQNANIVLDGGATLNAERASSGSCPSTWNAGIRAALRSTISVADSGSSMSGYLWIGTDSSAAIGGLGTKNNLDAQQSVINELGADGAGVNSCTDP